MKKIVWIIFLFLLLVLSYSREVLFLSINAILSGNTQFYAQTIKITWLVQQPAEFLIQLKYILTGVYSILFALISVLGLQLSFKDKLPTQLAKFFYISLFIIVVLALTTAFLTGTFNITYPYFRFIIEYLHTPLFFFFFSLSFFVKKSISQEH